MRAGIGARLLHFLLYFGNGRIWLGSLGIGLVVVVGGVLRYRRSRLRGDLPKPTLAKPARLVRHTGAGTG
jgi:hypothetical protein